MEAKRSDIWKVPLSQIVIREGLNIRKDYGDLQELSDSIKENGVKVPMRGYKDGDNFVIVDGHRRYHACSLIGEDIIVPFIVESKGYNDEQRIVDMFITNDGKQLTPLEQSEGVSRLLNFGWEIKDIAKKIGRSVAYVGRLRKLDAAPMKIKKMVQQGDLSATDAISVMPEEDLELLYQGVKRKKLNSLKEFKKWNKNLDINMISEKKIDVYDIINKIASNDIDVDYLNTYFKS